MIPHSWPLKPPPGVSYLRPPPGFFEQKTQGRFCKGEAGETCWVCFLFFFGDKIWNWTRETNIVQLGLIIFDIFERWNMTPCLRGYHSSGTWKRPYIFRNWNYLTGILSENSSIRTLSPIFSEQPQAQNNLKKTWKMLKKFSKTCCQLEAPA